jgi:DNA-binding CsgD family transcriptional regulator
MLPGGYASVLEARSRDEFRAEIVRFANQLGFQTVSALTVVDHGPGSSEFIAVDNTPSGYLDVYANPISFRRDPVMQHCKRASVPIIWNQDTYVASGVGEIWEQQARFGYRTGIAMALHLPEGLQRLVADLQLFAVHAQEAALRLLLPTQLQPERPSLTPRELEALRWTMEGKTAWEVGAILGITERTAVMHLNNAMHKLGCVSKHQAVVKAMQLGLIH